MSINIDNTNHNKNVCKILSYTLKKGYSTTSLIYYNALTNLNYAWLQNHLIDLVRKGYLMKHNSRDILYLHRGKSSNIYTLTRKGFERLIELEEKIKGK